MLYKEVILPPVENNHTSSYFMSSHSINMTEILALNVTPLH